MCLISRGTAFRISKGHKKSDFALLTNVMDPVPFPSGRHYLLHAAKESLIVDRLLVVVRGVFPVGNVGLTALMTSTAANSRKRFAKGIPSPDVMQFFRARNRQIANRVAENVISARLYAQNTNHFSTLKTVLTNVDKDYSGMLPDPRNIRNWDETAVFCEYCKKTRCYKSASGARRLVRD